jgi:ATP-binding cassette subfamily B protein
MSTATINFFSIIGQKVPIRWVLAHIVRYKLLVGAFLLCVGANAALAAVAPVLVGVALNAVLENPPNLILIAWVAIGILVSQAGRAAIQFGRVYASAVLSERVERDSREELYVSLLGKSMAFHETLPSGEAMSRVTNDVHELNLMIKLGVGVVAMSASFLFTPVLLAPYYYPSLIVEPLLFLFGYILIVARYLHRLHNAADHTRLTFGALNRHLAETLSSIEIIKGMAQEAQEIASFEERTSAYRDAAVTQGRVEARFFALLLLGVIEGLGFAHALLLASKGEMTTGGVVGYTGLLFLFGYPTFTSLSAYSHVALGLAAARRILAVMQGDDEQDNATKGHQALIQGRICFDHVSFGYSEEHTVLQDISFEIEPGQTVALVGETGVGKTTLVRLLNRTYDVKAGHIFIDGIDIRDWRLATLRPQIAMIEQDVFLFSRTIAQNISFGVKEATQERIEDAARAAQAHEFVLQLKDGYETLVGVRGVTLSGGQRQRIALARALLTRPRILVLDDATSAVDSATEDQIQRAIMQASMHQTTFLITHRLSQIRSADKILLLHKGRLEACGTHEDLLRSSLSYQRLFQQDGFTRNTGDEGSLV